MGLSLKPEHLKRYAEIIRLFVKYGHGDLVKNAVPFPELSRPAVAGETPKAEELTADLEKMGPTFVKLGQVLSTRPDLLPPAYTTALCRLQDNVEPFPFEEVEAIVPVELGVRMSKGFTTFEPKPLAAASLGQVHRATLRDGREVVVKIQRPNIREQIVEDLAALEEVAELLDAHTEAGERFEFSTIVKELRKSLLAELDYRQEAQNLKRLGARLASFEKIVIPAPIEDYTTSRVLTMEYISGRKITALNPVVQTDFDGAELAEELFRAYLQQIFVDGFFHADPHPGNVFLTDDHRIALIDLGMVAWMPARLQEQLLQFVLAVSEGRGDEAATAALKIGEAKPGFDKTEFRRRIADFVSRHQDASIAQIQLGGVIMEVTNIAADCHIRVPRELTMLGKTLLNLDMVGRTLDPAFDPNASIRRNGAAILQHRLFKSLSPGNLFSGLLEIKDLVEHLPARLNRLTELIANNELRLNVDAIDEEILLLGLQKVANRIALGLILAALIIGAAMLMRVDTSFRIFGYPGFAMICFLMAAGGGVALAVNILAHDKSRPK